MKTGLVAGGSGRRIGVAVLAAAVLLAAWMLLRHPAADATRPDHLALVVPDEYAADDPGVTAWRDAAQEIGVPLVVIRASELLRDDAAGRHAALILPDQVHRRMNDALLADLARRVETDGARLMIVHDAGVLDMNGHYADESRLSALTGVRYALYGRLTTGMVGEQRAWVEAAALPLLRMPPGKLVSDDDNQPLTSAHPAPRPDARFGMIGYQYGRMRYPAFATTGDYPGLRLMTGEDGTLLAGLRRAGAGQVLFVNLPLAYLKLRTDGLFLSSFLGYFATGVAGLPTLSPMPDAQGALVMNWHIDSGAAVPAMEQLAARGGLGQGPYSVHLTAGPDVDREGDGQGMDLANNATMRRWVARFAERGDEIGSHGGWIHNAFGKQVNTQDPAKSAALIERNTEVVSQASKAPVREYSAPTGSHPGWVTPWLRAHGFTAYYFTGDIGMAPTRSYQDGRRGPDGIWSFPVLTYGADASFEEARANRVDEEDIDAWLQDVADYCATNRTVRLVYFHPGGIALFPAAFEHWISHVAELKKKGTLRWATMASYAAFAERRTDVTWTLAREDRHLVLDAKHPASLDAMTWLFPMARYGRPVVRQGRAEVAADGADWRVIADETQHLVLDIEDHGIPPLTDGNARTAALPTVLH